VLRTAFICLQIKVLDMAHFGNIPLVSARMVPALVFAAALLLLTPGHANAAEFLWGGDFEEGTPSIDGSSDADFQKHVYDDGTAAAVDVQTNSGMGPCGSTREGKYAGRARILAGGAGQRVRAEVQANDPIHFNWDGPEYWTSVSICLAEWPKGSDANTFYQIHAPNEEKGATCDFAGNAITIGVEYDTGFIAVIDNPDGKSSGNGAFSQTKKVYLYNVRDTLGQWQDFIFKFRLSTKGDGYFTVWHNGKQVASGSGLVNVNWKDSCGNPIPKTYSNGPHVGIYGGANDAGPKTLYMDSLKVAEGTNAYALVAPGDSTEAVPSPPLNLVVE
jgi:hypothetical protein